MIAVLFYGAWLGAQAATTAPAAISKISWARELQLPDLSAIDGLLSEPLGDLPAAVMEDKSVRHIRTCGDLLAISKVKFRLSPDNDLAWDSLASEGVRCFALDILKSAKPASTSFLQGFKFARAHIAKLPARFTLAFSDDEERLLKKAEVSCTPWGKYDPSLRVRVKGEEGEVSADGWTGRLVLYARGDLTGDGIEDLLFLREGQVKGGTASASTLFIVTQTSGTACLRIVRTLPTALGSGPRP